jgi:predicted permease
MLDRLAVDVVSALRGLRAAPAVPIAAVLTTSLAVGVNLAMAGLIDRALLSPPAHIVEPERVFTVGFEVAAATGERSVVGPVSFPIFEAVQDRVPAVNAASWNYLNASIDAGGRRRSVKAKGVTGNYFSMLGAGAQLGRALMPEDDLTPVGAPVVVLSHSLWRTAFGADPQVIGREVVFNSLNLQIVGVMPAGFSGHNTARTDLWLPLSTAMQDLPGWHRRANMSVVEIGVRITSGQNVSSAASQVHAETGSPVILAPIIGADVAPTDYRIAMWLMAISLIVLVAGLANAATLFLVRSSRRRRETSIRAAMGATRGRLFRQLVVESAIVASLATVVALVAGSWLDEIVRRVAFGFLIEQSGVNVAVIATALAGGVGTFMAAIVAGALQLPDAVTSEDLAGRRRIWRRSMAQHQLLVVQATLAVLLITGAGMFAQSYARLVADEYDARLERVLTVSFDDGPGSVREQDQLFAAAAERVRRVPGIDAAAVYAMLPFGSGIKIPPIDVPGVGEPRLDGWAPHLIEAAPELFDILGIDIVRGRALIAADDRGAPVAVVSETMARVAWPRGGALGKCFRIGFDPTFDPATSRRPSRPPASAPCREVVGIARDRRRPSARPNDRRVMHFYVPIAQGLRIPPALGAGPLAEGLVVRTRADVDVSLDAIRAAVTEARSDLPFVQVRPYQTMDAPRLTHFVTGTRLLLIFGALALVTAALGIYAAFSHSVTERRHEMAVRLAVGASRGEVLLMILREGMAVAARGAATGIIAAGLVGLAARSIIYGLSSPGLLVIVGTTVVVVLVAAIATWLPALSASRADPNTLLRVD